MVAPGHDDRGSSAIRGSTKVKSSQIQKMMNDHIVCLSSECSRNITIILMTK